MSNLRLIRYLFFELILACIVVMLSAIPIMLTKCLGLIARRGAYTTLGGNLQTAVHGYRHPETGRRAMLVAVPRVHSPTFRRELIALTEIAHTNEATVMFDGNLLALQEAGQGTRNVRELHDARQSGLLPVTTWERQPYWEVVIPDNVSFTNNIDTDIKPKKYAVLTSSILRWCARYRFRHINANGALGGIVSWLGHQRIKAERAYFMQLSQFTTARIAYRLETTDVCALLNIRTFTIADRLLQDAGYTLESRMWRTAVS